MSSILLTFDLGLIPQERLPLFLMEASKLDTLFRQLRAPEPEPHYEAPPAESLPLPDDEETETPLEEMDNQQLRDVLADLTGKPRGRKSTPKFPKKADLIVEIRRLRSLQTRDRTVEERDGTVFVTVRDTDEGRMSEDSLDGAPAAPASDGEGSTASKRRGPKKLSEMTPEELEAHKAKVAARKAKKAATKED